VGGRLNGAVVGDVRRRAELREHDDVGGVLEQEEGIHGEQRQREAEDLAHRELHLAPAHAPEQPAPQRPNEHRAVHDHAERGGGDGRNREPAHVAAGEDHAAHRRQPKPGAEHVLAEEDRARSREHREHAHEQLVERLHGGQQEEDQQDRDRVVALADAARHEAAQRGDEEHDRDTHARDRRGDHEQRPKEPAVLPALVVRRQEPRDGTVEPEHRDALTGAGDRERVREHAVIGLAQVPHDHDLDAEVHTDRQHPAEQEQARAAYLTPRLRPKASVVAWLRRRRRADRGSGRHGREGSPAARRPRPTPA
jgi:hypothetical protein